MQMLQQFKTDAVLYGLMIAGVTGVLMTIFGRLVAARSAATKSVPMLNIGMAVTYTGAGIVLVVLVVGSLIFF